MESVQKNIDTILSDAIEFASESERQSYLDKVCGDDTELRREAEKLVADHFEAGDFLEQPAAMADVTIDQSITERPGTMIGSYKLREKIGEGGFGVVYVAEQTEPIRRKVALKIIKPGMDTREVIARFEAERQALAMMDHPNIANILDGGTTSDVRNLKSEVRREDGPQSSLSSDMRLQTSGSGRPYFVMELVNGIAITEFSDEQELSTNERLELFVQVCWAVQHAHNKGVIHRDIKPSNVMVTLSDGRPVPKVIDFGVSKALSQPLTLKTVYTAYGQLLGTPLYMSPEQAQLSAHDVDTRSDIYSLGVLLYELLTGSTPFDKQTLQRSCFDEMRRIIREVDPPRPSDRVSTLKAEALSTVSEHRGIGPKKLSHSLRGELDWIVMKALEKDRNRRYETASAFAADVQRYLRDEPVHARPPSTSYRLRKYARRNSAALVTVALVVMCLLAGTGVSIWLAVRAIDAEQLAESRLEDVGKQQQQTESQRQRAEANLQLALETLEQIYLPLATDKFSEEFELAARDRQFLQKVLPFYEQLAAQKADDPNMRNVKAHAYLRVGNIYRNLRTHLDEKIQPAESAFRQAIALFQQLTDNFPGNLEYQQKLAQSYRGLGTLLLPRHRPEAKQSFRTAIRLYEPVIAESDNPWDFASRGFCYRQIRRHDDAIADYLKAVEIEPNNAQFHQDLCRLYTIFSVQDLGLAVKHAQKAVEHEPDNPTYCSELSYVYLRVGNLQAARAASAKALRLDPNLAKANGQMAEILRLEGKGDQALAFAQKAFQDSDPEPAALQTRGKIYALLGRYPEAIADLSKAIELKPEKSPLYRARGHIYAKFGRFEEALTDYTKAIELEPEDARLLNNVAFEMVRVPGWEPQMLEYPIAWLRRAIELNPEAYYHWNNLGLAYYRAGNWPEAIAALEKSLSLNPDRFNFFFLAMSHWQLGNQEEAQQWYDTSVEWMEKERFSDETELVRFRSEAEELMGIEKRK